MPLVNTELIAIRKNLFNKIFYLIAANIVISLLFLSVYKLFIYHFNIDTLIHNEYSNLSKFGFNIIILLLIFGLSVKWQLRTFQYLKTKPWVLFFFKVTFMLLVSLAASLIVNYYFQYFQHLMDPISTNTWIIENTRIYFAGALYLFFLFLFMYALIGSVFVSSFLTSFFLIMIGFVHYNKLLIRVEPLYPFDYKQISQLKDVIPMISAYVSLPKMILAIISFLLIMALMIFLPNITISLGLRGGILVVSLTMLYAYSFFPKTFMNSFMKKNHVTIVKWNQIENYQVNGFLFGFISNLQDEGFQKPKGYSKKKVRETAKKYISNSDKNSIHTNQLPNIIYLMSESFWDPTKINVAFSSDPIPHLRQFMNKYSSGYVLSPVFGGATANVEFEALTGFTTSFLNAGVIPYQDIMDKKTFVPSVVSDLERKGYSSLAIHPFNKVFYKRNVVYDTLGFDKFLDQETMKNNDKTKGGVITDQSLMFEILDNIKKQAKPLFIHAVSMQNHMPYNPGAYEENQIKVHGLTPESTSILEVYTEGIRKSDEALQLLLEEIQQLHEPTIVLFWGDHLPILGANMSVYKEAGYDDGNPDINEYRYFETPLLIYSNFETEQKTYECISPFYLAQILYETCGLQKPSFYNLLAELREQMGIQAIKGSMIMGSNRESIKNPTKKQKQLLEDYRLLQYDLLIGRQYSLDLLYR
ncbi:LTA synthase family protein [Ectobacillus antri]|uniref:LTA synthase family protein n=1 Tax=Ectobacillus antri TaxID=2486280 RepID=UPI000F593305|nr:LTA synthase family protein [Ectobacillus antri]